MRRPSTVLLVTTLFALIVFVFNALPSTVILDDDSKIAAPAAPIHRSVGATPDLVLATLFALVWGVSFINLLRFKAPRQSFALTTSSIARAPPHSISFLLIS